MGWLRNLFRRNDDIERDLPERIRKYSDTHVPVSACPVIEFNIARPAGSLPLTAEPGTVALDENGQTHIWNAGWWQIRNDPIEDTLAEAVAGSVEKTMESVGNAMESIENTVKSVMDDAAKRGEKLIGFADSHVDTDPNWSKNVKARKSGSTASGPTWFETMQKAKKTELLAPWFRNSSQPSCYVPGTYVTAGGSYTQPIYWCDNSDSDTYTEWNKTIGLAMMNERR